MNREQQEEPRGVIFILVSPDKRVLMQQRDQRDSRFAGMWCLPGGSCEGDEEYIQTVVREAKEEFDAELNARECVLMMCRLGNKNAVYACHLRSTEGLNLKEGADMRWMSVDEVEQIDLGFHQADIVPVLREFLYSNPRHCGTA